jgi:putative endonuclease
MASDKQPCVYILASAHYGSLYIGVTSGLDRRMSEHRQGLIPGQLVRYGIKRLVHFETFGDMASAIAREKQLKNWHRQWKINLVNAENPYWVDLAVSLGFPALPTRLHDDGP